MRAVYECCEGYVENDHRNGCIAFCSNSCDHGVCVSPNVCKCEEGFGGPLCDVSKYFVIACCVYHYFLSVAAPTLIK